MGWTITPPTTNSGPGAEVCITVTGGPGAPQVQLTHGDGSSSKPDSIRSKGGGVYVICFKKPPGVRKTQVSVGSPGSAPTTAFI